jgi:hypothetical protein
MEIEGQKERVTRREGALEIQGQRERVTRREGLGDMERERGLLERDRPGERERKS